MPFLFSEQSLTRGPCVAIGHAGKLQFSDTAETGFRTLHGAVNKAQDDEVYRLRLDLAKKARGCATPIEMVCGNPLRDDPSVRAFCSSVKSSGLRLGSKMPTLELFVHTSRVHLPRSIGDRHGILRGASAACQYPFNPSQMLKLADQYSHLSQGDVDHCENALKNPALLREMQIEGEVKDVSMTACNVPWGRFEPQIERTNLTVNRRRATKLSSKKIIERNEQKDKEKQAEVARKLTEKKKRAEEAEKKKKKAEGEKEKEEETRGGKEREWSSGSWQRAD